MIKSTKSISQESSNSKDAENKKIKNNYNKIKNSLEENVFTMFILGGGTRGELFTPLHISIVVSYRKPVLLLQWRKKHCIFEKKVKQESKSVGKGSGPGFGATRRVGLDKLNRKRYYNLKHLSFKAGIKLWALPL